MNTRAKHRTLPDQSLTTYPPGIKYIIGNEGAERFSYYGMKSILYIYIAGLFINHHGFSEDEGKATATAAIHGFSAAIYMLAIIGGLLADRLLGKYRTILTLSLVYCAGHVALALFEDPALQLNLFGEVLVDPVTGLFIGLGLIAVGSGGIKPCVSAHVGDQFGKGNWHLLEKIFNAFYFIINFGSFFATLLIPAIRGDLTVDPITGHYSYAGSPTWAFAVPGILMGVATFFFWLGRKEFVHVQAKPAGLLGALDVLSGTLLFAGTLGIPLFVFMTEANVAIWILLVACLACIAAFCLLFAWRQRIQPDDGPLAVIFHSLRAAFSGKGRGFYHSARERWGDDIVDGTRAAFSIFTVFLMVSVFWGLFHQHSSTWIGQAKEMDRAFSFDTLGWVAACLGFGLVVGLAIGLTLANKLTGAAKRRTTLTWLAGSAVVTVLAGLLTFALASEDGVMAFSLQASQVPAVNPIMVMILLPLTTFGLYPLLDRFWKMTPLRRMTVGMMMASLSFVMVALIQGAIDSEGKGEVHVVWQLIPYFIITLSEVMVSVTGLKFGYSQAPKRLKSVIMGFWLVMVAFGDLLVAGVAQLDGIAAVDFFWIFAALMAVAAGLFGLRAAFYQYRDYTQE